MLVGFGFGWLVRKTPDTVGFLFWLWGLVGWAWGAWLRPGGFRARLLPWRLFGLGVGAFVAKGVPGRCGG